MNYTDEDARQEGLAIVVVERTMRVHRALPPAIRLLRLLEQPQLTKRDWDKLAELLSMMSESEVAEAILHDEEAARPLLRGLSSGYQIYEVPPEHVTRSRVDRFYDYHATRFDHAED